MSGRSNNLLKHIILSKHDTIINTTLNTKTQLTVEEVSAVVS